MQSLVEFINHWFLHLDVHLASLVNLHGSWVYLILFLVIFVETGVVVMPFLPGDSLLFVAGALSANGLLDPWLLFGLLVIAAVSGDAVNFLVGTWVRKKTIDTRRICFLKPEHINRTRDFFALHGGKAIILARFVPIIRTLAPFVAALGHMPSRIFFAYNLLGALLWVGLLIACGHIFGAISWVSSHLTMVILAIVFISILPAMFAYLHPALVSRND